MGLFNFNTLPVNTLVGADWKTFMALTKGQHIAKDKRANYWLTKAFAASLVRL